MYESGATDHPAPCEEDRDRLPVVAPDPVAGADAGQVRARLPHRQQRTVDGPPDEGCPSVGVSPNPERMVQQTGGHAVSPI